MKIIAIGWNYAPHNKEMNCSLIPQEPVVFLKPDSALLPSGRPFYIPSFSQEIEYELEVVIRIGKLGKNIDARFAHRYIESVTVGLDLTARDLQRRLRESGSPWEISKGFDGSAVVGEMRPKDNFAELQALQFSLYKNGIQVQQGNTNEMLFSIADIIAYVSQFYTLKIGDLIFTGTPSGVGPIAIDDHLEGYIGNDKLLDLRIK